MRRKLLIVSPRFAPIDAADNQRVRQMLPLLAQHGWDAFVVSVQPSDVEGARDEALVAQLADHAKVRAVAAIPLHLTRLLGFGSLSMRSHRAIDRMVRAWHAEEQFDLVFFSTTEFGLWTLGPRWRQQLGLRYVLDWQDPWVSDYYVRHPSVRKPGGAFKFGITQWLARRREPRVARSTAHHVSVSSAYPRELMRRYPDIPMDRFSTIPFAYLEQPTVNSPGAPIHAWRPVGCSKRYWAYVGRGGADMHFSLSVIFDALARERAAAPERFADLKLYFVGTDYAPPARARYTVIPVAQQFGVDDMVVEMPGRIPSSDAASFLRGAEALIVPGSDDSSYSASKIYPYLAVGRPLLVVSHRKSDVVRVLANQSGVTSVAFENGTDAEREHLVGIMRAQWMTADLETIACVPRDISAFTASAMTDRLVDVFDRAMAQS